MRPRDLRRAARRGPIGSQPLAPGGRLLWRCSAARAAAGPPLLETEAQSWRAAHLLSRGRPPSRYMRTPSGASSLSCAAASARHLRPTSSAWQAHAVAPACTASAPWCRSCSRTTARSSPQRRQPGPRRRSGPRGPAACGGAPAAARPTAAAAQLLLQAPRCCGLPRAACRSSRGPQLGHRRPASAVQEWDAIGDAMRSSWCCRGVPEMGRSTDGLKSQRQQQSKCAVVVCTTTTIVRFRFQMSNLSGAISRDWGMYGNLHVASGNSSTRLYRCTQQHIIAPLQRAARLA
jgi:hypothetical protein